MINTGPSNDKIYHRCVNLIADEIIRVSWAKKMILQESVTLSVTVANKLPRFRDTQLSRKLSLCSDSGVTVDVHSLINGIAEYCLLMAIYKTDDIPCGVQKANVSEHIKQFLTLVDSPAAGATRQDDSGIAVLPVAFLLAVSVYHMLGESESDISMLGIITPKGSRNWNFESATSALLEEPRIGQLLKSILSSA